MGLPAIWMNGRITEDADARVSIFDHGLLYGDGIFEGIRFYERRAFRLEEHLARLERSAAAIELVLPYSRAELRRAFFDVVECSEKPDGYVRLVVTRGRGDLRLDPRSCERPTTFLASAPFAPLVGRDGVRDGVTVVVASTRQAAPDVVDPRIKSLNYLNRLLARLEAIRAGADEAIMLNARGLVAEGTTDNLFIVRDGRLIAPPASDGALEGITRAAVLDLARQVGIPAREQSIGTYDLYVADELFLVGTGVGLVAARSLDGRRIPACPGPVYQRIASAFDALVRSESSAA